ncbi:MAG TPA: thioredoxin-disulfide reductase [Verrucomicrobiales bacterium]|nr:thioredoxin-disulfide reductase [Deltaproteobacteria bacterium]HAT20119.1 thioredoxin-disulfide reductase [Verrucomicrobiales bacterium]
MENVIIIGTGCAGWTAAIYTARANLEPIVLAGDQIGGQLTTTSEVENYPGFPQGVDGSTLMFSIQQQAEKFGARIEYRTADRVDRANDGTFVVNCGKERLEARTVIVATGARPRLLGLPNEENGKNGLTTCATCDGAFYRDMPVAVVGGGDSACEEATFLTRFATKVYLVHRRDELRASRIMAERALAHEKIEPVWNTELTAYHPGEDGKMESVSIRNRETGEEGALEVKGVFIAIGHIPNSGFLNDLADLDESGYILQIPGKTATKTPGLYAAGDVADHYYRQAITAAGQGCAAALEAERYLTDQED